MVAALVLAAGAGGCEATPSCDAAALAAFRALPPAPGVTVAPKGSPGIGCTDTVTVDDPAAVVAHYEAAMAAAGWTVVSDGGGVLGRTGSSGLRIDPLEGRDLGFYVLGPEDLEVR